MVKSQQNGAIKSNKKQLFVFFFSPTAILLKKRGSAMTKNNVRPFGFLDKLGYLFGDFGKYFIFVIPAVVFNEKNGHSNDEVP